MLLWLHCFCAAARGGVIIYLAMRTPKGPRVSQSESNESCKSGESKKSAHFLVLWYAPYEWHTLVAS